MASPKLKLFKEDPCMPVLADIQAYADDLTAIRQDLHAHPELGFEEVRTSGIVAEKLQSWGIEVHRNIGKTGVVGVLKGRREGGRTIGLRADMDALPIEETTNLPYRSRNPGRMHACGHDGHTAMLLGAARYLAETRDFAGTAVFIFQPAEEGLGGARAMIADKLFERFPCDEIYCLHNKPELAFGDIVINPGRMMAGADFFDIRVVGCGSHGAAPHMARDPIIVATSVVQALQTIVSRNVRPTEAAVVSVTQIHAGSAYNVVPGEATICGTFRMFTQAGRDLIRQRTKDICAGIGATYGVEITVDIRQIFDVVENDEKLSLELVDIANEVVGKDKVTVTRDVQMESEDFADMLRAVPGCYFNLGHGTGVSLHNPAYTLDDDVLPIGASILARIMEKRLGG
jgi:amidohydrolase